MRPFFSDYNTSGTSVDVDWVRLSPYAGSGSYDSRVFDAGQTSTWGAVDWNADVPNGTTLQVQVRTGETSTPDGSWSSFIDATKGVTSGGVGRYLQYRLILVTTDPFSTASIRSVSIG